MLLLSLSLSCVTWVIGVWMMGDSRKRLYLLYKRFLVVKFLVVIFFLNFVYSCVMGVFKLNRYTFHGSRPSQRANRAVNQSVLRIKNDKDLDDFLCWHHNKISISHEQVKKNNHQSCFSLFNIVLVGYHYFKIPQKITKTA